MAEPATKCKLSSLSVTFVCTTLFFSRETLFGGTDRDYREPEVATKSNSSNLDADSIFEINSKCLQLAEQKYKCNELSSEEYHATLKLLQNILESEVKRLTVQQA